jgi:solute carrier family 25 protein 38
MVHDTRKGGSLVTSFLAGASSATCSTLMFQPLDLVKTRMQVRALAAPLCLATATVQGGPATLGMFSTFVNVVQRENISGLWRGTSPVSLPLILSCACSVYSNNKQYIEPV